MNILLFSEDRFGAEVLLEILKTDTVGFVVCPYFDNNIHKRLEAVCKAKGIEFYRTKNINDDYVQNKVKDGNFDLLVSCHCSRIIAKEIFTLPKLGAVNLHPSLLPKYRGMSPQHWPIINGDKETAVTIHEIKEEVDAGAIVKQIKIQIHENETVFELQNRMLPVYRMAFSELLQDFKNGTVQRIAQSPQKEIYYGKFYPEYAQINLRETKESVKNLVRAVTHPYCGASYANYTVWSVCDIEAEQENKIMKNHTRCGIFSEEKQLYLRLFDGVLEITDYSVKTIHKIYDMRGGVLRYSICHGISGIQRCAA